MRLFNRRYKVKIPNELRSELHSCIVGIKEEAKKTKYSYNSNDSDVRYSVSGDERELKIDKLEDVKPVSVEKAVEEIKEEIKKVEKESTFKDVLTGFIDERNLKDPEVYKKAHVDRRTFSKIINQTYNYTKKEIVIRLGLALELNMDDFEKLLKSNCDSFSDLSLEDTAIKYCIRHKIYDIDTVNDILYSCSLKLI